MNISTEQEIAAITGVAIETGAPLARYTGFRTGGDADYVVTPNSQSAFLEVVRVLRRHGQRFFILGNGTNILALDRPYHGWIIRTESALGDIAFGRGGRVYSGAGVSLVRLCRCCAENGLTGLEFAYGIPGTVGGAVFMNAGAYGGEMRDVAASIEVMDGDGNVLRLLGGDMGFAYRRSAAQSQGYTIIGADFQLRAGQKAAIWARMNELMGRRTDKQPLEYPSCGSTFKRPEGAYASKLIDDCGLRGRSVGGAQVSEKHCGFVINRGGATSDDILALIALIKRTVLEKTGFALEEEILVLK